MATKDNDPLVEVFGGTPWEAEVVKGLLESNNIPCHAKRRNDGQHHCPYAGLGGEMKVLVNEADYGAALQLIDQKDKDKDE